MKRIVAQITQLSALLPELEDQARIAEYESKRDGATKEKAERAKQARDAASGAEHERLKAIVTLNGLGIQLKGPLEGLIDFPSYRDGEAKMSQAARRAVFSASSTSSSTSTFCRASAWSAWTRRRTSAE